MVKLMQTWKDPIHWLLLYTHFQRHVSLHPGFSGEFSTPFSDYSDNCIIPPHLSVNNPPSGEVQDLDMDLGRKVNLSDLYEKQ